MRAHNHQLRAHSSQARAVALAHPRQDAAVGMSLGVVALALATLTVFAVLSAGWVMGGFVLQALGVAA